MESKYLNRFTKLVRDGKDLVQLRGDRVLVEVLPKEELKSAGGLYMATSDSHRTDTKENQATLALVLMTGEGYYDESTGDDLPLGVKPGDVVLLADMGLKRYTTFPGLTEYTANTIALTRDSEIHMIFRGAEAYEKAKGLLNAQ